MSLYYFTQLSHQLIFQCKLVGIVGIAGLGLDVLKRLRVALAGTCFQTFVLGTMLLCEASACWKLNLA